MKNINWTRKLTSRKMWTAVASFVSMMIVATGGGREHRHPGNGPYHGRGVRGGLHHWRGFDRRRQRGNRSGSDNGRGSVNHGQAGVY